MTPIIREGVGVIIYYSAYLMLIMALVTFLALTLWTTAPYGKFTANKGWGMLLPAKICWMIMESPNLWNSLFIYFLSEAYFGAELRLPIYSLTNQWLLSLYLLHYVNRSLIFPCFLAQGNPMPISVMFFAFIYCYWNSWTQATSLILLHDYPADYRSSPSCLIGTAIFFLGFILNIQSDLILIRLKQQRISREAKESDEFKKVPSQSEAQKKGYVIPRGGMFEYVSAANYCKLFSFVLICCISLLRSLVGEIVEWIGFAIACQSIPALAFAVYTFANLAPRGLAVSSLNLFYPLIVSLSL